MGLLQTGKRGNCTAGHSSTTPDYPKVVCMLDVRTEREREKEREREREREREKQIDESSKMTM